MAVDNSRTITRSALSFLSGTLISRFSGLGRDVSMAFCFGAHPAIAAFMVAFRFSNLFRRLLGEGPLLSGGFIPHFEAVRAESPREGALFFRDLFASLSLFLVGLLLVSEGVCWGWLAWGGVGADTAELITLSMLMLPGLLFICLFGLCSALLQCERHFFMTGFAPVAFNLVWIAAAWMLRGVSPHEAAVGLSVAVVGAFFMQWVVTMPQVLRYCAPLLRWRDWLKPRLFTESLRVAAKPLFFTLIGVGAVQINSTLDALFARFAEAEGPAYLWYAIRLEQVPLSLFGIALGSALLPALTRRFQSGDVEAFQTILRHYVQRALLFMLPVSGAILALGLASVNLVFGRGEFDATATAQTTLCLWGYGLGLLPSVLVLILSPAFYAQKDYRTPMVGAIWSVVLNVALNALFVFGAHFGAISIALATSAAAWFNAFFLLARLGKQETLISLPVVKTLLCTLVATASTLAMGHYFVSDGSGLLLFGKEGAQFPRGSSMQLLHFGVLTGAFALLLCGWAWMLNVRELMELVQWKTKSRTGADAPGG